MPCDTHPSFRPFRRNSTFLPSSSHLENPDNTEAFLTDEEVARLLRSSVNDLDRLRTHDGIPFIKNSHSRIICGYADVMGWLNARIANSRDDLRCPDDLPFKKESCKALSAASYVGLSSALANKLEADASQSALDGQEACSC